MEKRDLEELLDKVAAGDVTAAEATDEIQADSAHAVSDLGYARVDHQRGVRQGVSEVIYGEGKTAEQIAGIVAAMLGRGQKRVLITRIDADKARETETLLSERLVIPAAEEPDAADASSVTLVESDDDQLDEEALDLPIFTYYDLPRVATVGEAPEPDGRGTIVIATGGTSDIPVAEEAAITAEMLGNDVMRLYDVGVAGLHRLLSHADEISRAKVVVAVAGMEGALASVVAGLVPCPVIAVPTSVGYGASFNGLSALLSMLNSCASGVSVVNIDNGFGAGFQASLINHVE